MDKSSLHRTIDNLAAMCCRLMTEEERASFFEYRLARSKTATHTSPKLLQRTTYTTGINKGKPKEVWEIDGMIFNQLWSYISLYITKSVKHSYGFARVDIADEVEEIRLLLFKTLRFCGPTPCGTNLSQFLHTLVNNYLTNLYNENRRKYSTKDDLKSFEVKKRYKKLIGKGYSKDECIKEMCLLYGYTEGEIIDRLNSYMCNYKKLYFEDLDCDTDRVDGLVDKCSVDSFYNNDYEEILFNVEMPGNLKSSALLLMGGTSMSSVADDTEIHRTKLKKMFVAFLNER